MCAVHQRTKGPPGDLFYGSQGGFGLRQRGKSAGGDSTEPMVMHTGVAHRLQGNYGFRSGAMSSRSEVGSPTTFQ